MSILLISEVVQQNVSTVLCGIFSLCQGKAHQFSQSKSGYTMIDNDQLAPLIPIPKVNRFLFVSSVASINKLQKRDYSSTFNLNSSGRS
mmetsp:Transcript_29642/g.71673  ORF Transcript_29642/g.71673 Transcript_29642/m.71673 type:complete len:89 (-) Transcript_29642:685-951(-)